MTMTFAEVSHGGATVPFGERSGGLVVLRSNLL